MADLQQEIRVMKRRTFLKQAGLAAGGLMASSLLPEAAQGFTTPSTRKAARNFNADPTRPNILVVLVDQMRYPQGALNQTLMDQAAPRLAGLRNQSVSFGHHCAAANACSPSRSTLLTGLYTHQNGMFLTNTQGIGDSQETPSLNPGFPNWGSVLSSDDFGYNTYWWGKWHLSGNDSTTAAYAKEYGFDDGGLPTPSPNGGPGQGQGLDPVTTQVFKNWLNSATQLGPWCTTVSLVNPHDVEWFPKYSKVQPGQENPPVIPEFHASLPSNFERWPEAIALQGKPELQQAWVLIADAVFGVVPTNPGGPGYPELWYELLDLYYLVIQEVDKQIGNILDALAASSAADNTIIVFTSDHGEYGGAHGLRGKAFAAYEESIHVPLYVYDPTGEFMPSAQAGTERSVLTSHVDIMPLLMTLAAGNNDWRANPKYGHLADRADLAALLKDPNAKGRDYIIQTSDEDIPASAIQLGFDWQDVIVGGPSGSRPPSHCIGYRTKDAKLGVYSYFTPGTIDIQMTDQQSELYDYIKDGNLEEIVNRAPSGSAPDAVLYQQMYATLFDETTGAVPTELRKPLPEYLQPVQQEAMEAYLAFEAGKLATSFQYLPIVEK
jgi:arylsulfatase A-like enzyme